MLTNKKAIPILKFGLIWTCFDMDKKKRLLKNGTSNLRNRKTRKKALKKS